MADSTVNILFRLRDETQTSLRRIRKGLSEVNEELDDLDNQDTGKVVGQVDALRRELEEATEAMDETAEGFDRIREAGLAIAAIGTAIIAPFLLAAKAAGEFQTQIAEISTLTDPAVASNEDLRKSVIELSDEFGKDRADIAAALYQAISRGAQAGAEANGVLRASLLLSKAGLVSVESATNGLTSILNAFNLEMGEASAVSDSLFAAVRGGATTVEEMSRFLFQAAPLASALSVSFTELNAAIAAVTLSGTPTAQATTQIRAALQGLARDTPEVTEALGKYESVSDAIADQGLQKTFDQIAKAAGGSESELIKLVGSIEGVQAILQLTGEGSDRFTEQLENQEKSLGATAEAAEKIQQSFGVQLEQATVRVSNAFVELGEAFVPVLVPLVNAVGNAAVAFREFVASSEGFGVFIRVAGVIAAVVVAVGLLAVTLGVLSRAASFTFAQINLLRINTALAGATMGKTAVAARVLGVAVRFMLGPIGLAITAISLLAFGASAMADDFDDAGVAVDGALQNIDQLNAVQRLNAFTVATEQTALLTLKVEQQTAAIKNLKAEIKEGNFFSNFFKTSELDELEEGLKELQGQGGLVDTAREKAEELQDSLDEFSVKLVTTKQLEELELELDKNVVKVAELRKSLAEELELSVAPVAGIRRGKGFIPGQKEGVVTDKEQAGINITSAQIAGLDARNAAQKEFIEDAKEIKKVAKEEDDKKKKVTEDRLSLQERIKLARAQQQLSRAEAQGATIAAKAVKDATIAENVKLTEELEAQFAVRGVDAETFAKKSIEIAQSNADAELKIQELALAQAKVAREQALNVAAVRADGKADKLNVETINQTADNTVETIEARVVKIGTTLNTEIRKISADAAQSGAEGIKESIDTILSDLETGLALVTAQRQLGLISNADAATEVARLNDNVNLSLKEQLALLVALQEAGSQDPVVLAQLDRVNAKLEELTTTTNVFMAQLQTATESAFADFFEESLTNLNNVGEAFDQLIDDITASIRRLIAEQLANKLTEALFGNLFGGGEGGGGSVLGSLFGAKGGYVKGKEGGYIMPAHAPTRMPAYVKAKKGGIMKMAVGGGPVAGRGTKTSDSVPAMLSKGEYVMRAKAVDQYGTQMMEAINRGVAEPIIPPRRLAIRNVGRHRFASGGQVGPPTLPEAVAAAGGSQPTSLNLGVSEGALNLTMRDFLEREFGRIIAER
jgi:TP901 family phage tail tape measure protein